MSEELKPCPWCIDGGEPFISCDAQYFYVGCKKCGADGPYGDMTEEQAITAWNTRAAPEVSDLSNLIAEANSLLRGASHRLDEMADSKQLAAYDWWVGRRDTLVELIEKHNAASLSARTHARDEKGESDEG